MQEHREHEYHCENEKCTAAVPYAVQPGYRCPACGHRKRGKKERAQE